MIADEWARTWGEMVTVSRAAIMLGLSRPTIYKMIRAGKLKTGPDGRVLVREAARWANGQ